MGALFDLSFKKFVAPLVAKVVYILAMIGIVIAYLAWVVIAFQGGAGYGLVVLLIIGPILSLLYLAFIRVSLEALLASIFTAQNTAELVRLQGGTPPSMGGFSDAPAGPPAGPPSGYPTSPPAGSGPSNLPPTAPPTPPQAP